MLFEYAGPLRMVGAAVEAGPGFGVLEGAED